MRKANHFHPLTKGPCTPAVETRPADVTSALKSAQGSGYTKHARTKEPRRKTAPSASSFWDGNYGFWGRDLSQVQVSALPLPFCRCLTYNGRRVWERGDMSIYGCVVDSHCYAAESNTTSSINYTPIKKIFFLSEMWLRCSREGMMGKLGINLKGSSAQGSVMT